MVHGVELLQQRGVCQCRERVKRMKNLKRPAVVPIRDIHGTPPPDGLLKRMFDPVSKTDDPKAGGLGVSPAELTRTAKHHGWNEAEDPTGVGCYCG